MQVYQYNVNDKIAISGEFLLISVNCNVKVFDNEVKNVKHVKSSDYILVEVLQQSEGEKHKIDQTLLCQYLKTQQIEQVKQQFDENNQQLVVISFYSTNIIQNFTQFLQKHEDVAKLTNFIKFTVFQQNQQEKIVSVIPDSKTQSVSQFMRIIEAYQDSNAVIINFNHNQHYICIQYTQNKQTFFLDKNKINQLLEMIVIIRNQYKNLYFLNDITNMVKILNIINSCQSLNQEELLSQILNNDTLVTLVVIHSPNDSQINGYFNSQILSAFIPNYLVILSKQPEQLLNNQDNDVKLAYNMYQKHNQFNIPKIQIQLSSITFGNQYLELQLDININILLDYNNKLDQVTHQNTIYNVDAKITANLLNNENQIDTELFQHFIKQLHLQQVVLFDAHQRNYEFCVTQINIINNNYFLILRQIFDQNLVEQQNCYNLQLNPTGILLCGRYTE